MVAKLMLHIDSFSPMPLRKRGSLVISAPQYHGFIIGKLAQALIHVGSRQVSRWTQLYDSEFVEVGHDH